MQFYSIHLFTITHDAVYIESVAVNAYSNGTFTALDCGTWLRHVQRTDALRHCAARNGIEVDWSRFESIGHRRIDRLHGYLICCRPKPGKIYSHRISRIRVAGRQHARHGRAIRHHKTPPESYSHILTVGVECLRGKFERLVAVSIRRNVRNDYIRLAG